MSYKNGRLLFIVSAAFLSCWKPRTGTDSPDQPYSPPSKVLGYKPVYGTESDAKKIMYLPGAKPVVGTGNIYAFQNYIFQMDPGMGIHVIDNTIPSAAARIGFIQVKGCSQISIKDNKLYTNSYDDLVVLDFSDLNAVQEYSRLKGVFTEYRYYSPIASPPVPGYYECPVYGSFVTGWTKDSVLKGCYKN